MSDVLSAAITKLAQAHIDNPQLDARLLMCHALNIDRLQLISQNERVLTTDEMRHIEKLVNRRITNESIARIIGQREFWGLPFGLNEATLEPRPDSETLIESVLQRVQCLGLGGQNLSSLNPEPQTPNPFILDIGTGTGCLLLSLLHELPHATGLGLDLSARAIDQAQANASALGLAGRAQFMVNNWLDRITGTFDIIIANPPYIRSAIIPTLAPDVRKYDPLLALDGGVDGLAPYRILIPRLRQHLNPHGFAVFEIGYDQAAEVTCLFTQAGLQNITLHHDLGGNPRCVTASID